MKEKDNFFQINLPKQKSIKLCKQTKEQKNNITNKIKTKNEIILRLLATKKILNSSEKMRNTIL